MSTLFGKSRLTPPPPTLAEARPENVIGATAHVQGSITAEGSVRVEGRLEGSIEAGGNVIVGRTGRVTAPIHGQNVLVAGVVRGTVVAEDRLEILATGTVIGDILVRTLLIEDGGVFQGQSTMRDEAPPDALPAPSVPPAETPALS